MHLPNLYGDLFQPKSLAAPNPKWAGKKIIRNLSVFSGVVTVQWETRLIKLEQTPGGSIKSLSRTFVRWDLNWSVDFRCWWVRRLWFWGRSGCVLPHLELFSDPIKFTCTTKPTENKQQFNNLKVLLNLWPPEPIKIQCKAWEASTWAVNESIQAAVYSTVYALHSGSFKFAYCIVVQQPPWRLDTLLSFSLKS